MIIINKSGYLKYKNFKFKCSLGKGGVGVKRKEGDNITPKGIYKIIKIYYRDDRVKKMPLYLKLIKIKKNMGWCDDPKSKKYNQLVKLPNKNRQEKLYRKDNIYDLILALNYNMKPIIKDKGSAIFIHVANKNYKSTAGCIGLKKSDLINLVKTIKKSNKVLIN